MTTRLGYQNLVQIHDGENSRVYRAQRLQDGQPVVLKFLKAEYPTPDQLRRYRQEYHLTQQLQLPKVIKAYGLEEWQKTLVIILEDFGGDALKQWLMQYPQGVPIDLFLLLATKIADALGQLHSQSVIHKDINPTNIVFNSATLALKLIDLGISTQLSRENPSLQTPNALEGTLPYLSPEQTGRMNRALDYRTDFYSLGVTFYELLTGTLPFTSDDPMELVHCHIAKQPVPLGELAGKRIAPPIGEVVSKLMAKNAEDRYQSAWGLKADLEECAEQWRLSGAIAPFPLGRNDVSAQFQIPQKLYGRDREIAALLTAFERVADSHLGERPTEPEDSTRPPTELILITGYSGIGKSALVRSLYKPITAKRGYFIAGKFDQFQRNVPFSAVADAFAVLVKQVLGEPEAMLQQWRERWLNALGTNGQVVIDVIPEVELIVGAQPPVAELGASEAQNRFYLVFQRFIQACCSPEYPLVLFLDDMQWVDLATLNWLERLLGDYPIKYLLLIVAYRDNEVSSSHPLALTLNQLQRRGLRLQQITLAPLPLEQIGQLIADTLQRDGSTIEQLAELVIRKTEGNPFFTNEFLKTLYSEALLSFNYSLRQWYWNLRQIEAVNFTDNVVELMVGQLQKLPPFLQDILSIAACLGTTFSLKILSSIKNQAPAVIFAELKLAMDRGFVVARSHLDENLLIQDYQFGHDRIQQAAYSLIPSDEQAATHLQIGRLLLQHYSETEQEENLFDIVRHCNQGRALITQADERETLAQLNLRAGNKARHATAYPAAMIYLDIGIELLSDHCWQSQYELTLNLYVAAAEVAYLNADLDGMEQMATQVLQHAQRTLDKIKIYQIQIAAQTAQSEPLAAIELGRNALNLLGVELPSEPNEVRLSQALQAIANQIPNGRIETLVDLPIMTDANAQAALQILGMLVAPLFNGMPGLLPFLSSTMVSLSLQFGNTPASLIGYVIHGLVLCNFLGDVQTGYDFGKLASKLLERFNIRVFKSIVLLHFGGFIQHHKEALGATILTLRDAYTSGMETGDFLNAGYSMCDYFIAHFHCGIELDSWEPELAAYREAFTQLNQHSARLHMSIIWQTVQNLRTPVSQPDCLSGDAYDEIVMLPKHHQANELTALAEVYTCKLLLAYWFNDYDSALGHVAQANRYLIGISGLVHVPIFHFYAALAYLAVLSDSANQEQAEHLAHAETHQSTLYTWAQNAPTNHLHKWHLVEAERHRVLGNKTEAIELYERAIAGAREHQFLHEEALAHELAARFYLSWGKEAVAQAYMMEAHYGYQRWGATTKVKHLETQYPLWFQSVETAGSSRLLRRRKRFDSDRIQSSAAAFDLSTVMKASQAIASEIVLENLLQTLMKILLENAGAQAGCLLLPTSAPSGSTPSGGVGNLSIAIHSHADSTAPLPADAMDRVAPESVLYYVARTGESVVLDDVAQPNNFVHDPYIQHAKPLSILCYPLLNQGELVGLVYLENKVTTGAFTRDRVEFLQLLSGQIAIALTNAQLYAQVKANERQLEQFLEAVPVGIGILDANGHPYYLNQRAIELLGQGVVPEATPEGMSQVYQAYIEQTTEVYPSDRLPIVRAFQGEASTVDDIEIHQGDRIIPLEAWGTPIYNAAGEVQYALAAFQDISQRKQAEQILTNYSRTLEHQVAERTAELQRANQELSRLATLDGLTHIANRRHLDNYLALEWQRHRREQQPLALILMDIDYFKRYNDHYGHQGGDACLIRVAQTLAQVPQRPTDLVARYGGEEFAAVLPNTTLDGGLMLAEAMRHAIAALLIPHAQSEVSPYVTLSLGVAALTPTASLAPDTVIARADEALYRAKQQGRDRAIGYTAG